VKTENFSPAPGPVFIQKSDSGSGKNRRLRPESTPALWSPLVYILKCGVKEWSAGALFCHPKQSEPRAYRFVVNAAVGEATDSTASQVSQGTIY